MKKGNERGGEGREGKGREEGGKEKEDKEKRHTLLFGVPCRWVHTSHTTPCSPLISYHPSKIIFIFIFIFILSLLKL